MQLTSKFLQSIYKVYDFNIKNMDIDKPDDIVKKMLQRNIKHFLKKRMYEKLGTSKMK